MFLFSNIEQQTNGQFLFVISPTGSKHFYNITDHQGEIIHLAVNPSGIHRYDMSTVQHSALLHIKIGKKLLSFLWSNTDLTITIANKNGVFSLDLSDNIDNLVYNTYINEYHKLHQSIAAWSFLHSYYKNEISKDTKSTLIPASSIDHLSLKKAIAFCRDELFIDLNRRLKKTDNHLYADKWIKWHFLTLPFFDLTFKEIQLKEVQETNFKNVAFKNSGLLKSILKRYIFNLYEVFKDKGLLNKILNFLQNLDQETQLIFLINVYAHIEFIGDNILALDLSTTLKNNKQYKLTKDLEKKVNGYIKTKPGTKMLQLVNDSSVNNTQKQDKLSILIFAASNCEASDIELGELHEYYDKTKNEFNWKMVSLDTTAVELKMYIYDWKTICDFLGWESPNVKNYHVDTTPTLFVLDDTNIIMKRFSKTNDLISYLTSTNP